MYTFNKSERLNNKVAINKLFEKGQSVIISPFHLLWIENNNSKYSITNGNGLFEKGQSAIIIPFRL